MKITRVERKFVYPGGMMDCCAALDSIFLESIEDFEKFLKRFVEPDKHCSPYLRFTWDAYVQQTVASVQNWLNGTQQQFEFRLPAYERMGCLVYLDRINDGMALRFQVRAMNTFARTFSDQDIAGFLSVFYYESRPGISSLPFEEMLECLQKNHHVAAQKVNVWDALTMKYSFVGKNGDFDRLIIPAGIINSYSGPNLTVYFGTGEHTYPVNKVRENMSENPFQWSDKSLKWETKSDKIIIRDSWAEPSFYIYLGLQNVRRAPIRFFELYMKHLEEELAPYMEMEIIGDLATPTS